jgi:hypothetical protein
LLGVKIILLTSSVKFGLRRTLKYTFLYPKFAELLSIQI